MSKLQKQTYKFLISIPFFFLRQMDVPEMDVPEMDVPEMDVPDETSVVDEKKTETLKDDEKKKKSTDKGFLCFMGVAAVIFFLGIYFLGPDKNSAINEIYINSADQIANFLYDLSEVTTKSLYSTITDTLTIWAQSKADSKAASFSAEEIGGFIEKIQSGHYNSDIDNLDKVVSILKKIEKVMLEKPEK